MRCPRCKRQYDILRYVPMKLIDEFVLETTPVYKCPECRWIFAPIDGVIQTSLDQRNGHHKEQALELAGEIKQ